MKQCKLPLHDLASVAEFYVKNFVLCCQKDSKRCSFTECNNNEALNLLRTAISGSDGGSLLADFSGFEGNSAGGPREALSVVVIGASATHSKERRMLGITAQRVWIDGRRHIK